MYLGIGMTRIPGGHELCLYLRILRRKFLRQRESRVALDARREKDFEVRIILLEKSAQSLLQFRLGAVQRLEHADHRSEIADAREALVRAKTEGRDDHHRGINRRCQQTKRTESEQRFREKDQDPITLRVGMVQVYIFERRGSLRGRHKYFVISNPKVERVVEKTWREVTFPLPKFGYVFVVLVQNRAILVIFVLLAKTRSLTTNRELSQILCGFANGREIPLICA